MSNIKTKYPIYIISKGRWESRLTSKMLEKLKLPYHIVVEPQEYDLYASVIDPDKIYVLPFSNLGLGSIPARNWVWEHSISIGAEKHWILDDNIREIFRLHNAVRLRVHTGIPFIVLEDFTDRFENVAISGFHYACFGISQMMGAKYVKPFLPNVRVYSIMLIRNDIPYRWRGRYNEDTDLCLRVLKDGWCTILLYAFLAGKMQTMTMKGGNTEDLYKLKDDDGRLLMARSLLEQHPDVVRIIRRFGRWQHLVDYKPFMYNQLKLKDGIHIEPGPDNYGLELANGLRDRNE